jgi:hypothetical protein
MADFNQTPSGQASLSVAIANLSLATTGNGINLLPGSFPNNYPGATATFDLSPPVTPAAEPAPFDIYPSYRRPLRLIASTPVAEAPPAGPETYTWLSPNDANPPANSYRLYTSGYSRLSTTTSAGYKKDELLAGLTLGRAVSVLVNTITYTGTVSTAAVIDSLGTSSERVDVFFSMTPSFTDTTLADTAMVLTLL